MTLLATIIIVGLLIVIHELGHFLVAKKAGIFVEEFSLGMGPKVFGHKRRDTLYSLRLLPIGGFVKMAGMEPEEEEIPEGMGFNDKSVLARMSVIAAGPIMNFILAILLFIMVFSLLGIPMASEGTVIGNVLPDRPAAQAGLAEGDRVTEINGQRVNTWDEMVKIIHQSAGEQLQLTVARDEERRTIAVVPELDAQSNVGLIGVLPEVTPKRYGLFKSVWLGLVQSYQFTKLILIGLIQMITGEMKAEVAGPVGIFGLIGEAVNLGLSSVFTFAAVLSLHLGLINLFPIPALDGSRLVFLGFEGLRGRPLDPNKENMIHLVGFVLLMLLMLVITFNDIAKLFV